MTPYSSDCPAPPNIVAIVGGGVGGILAIGIFLLALWKIYATVVVSYALRAVCSRSEFLENFIYTCFVHENKKSYCFDGF